MLTFLALVGWPLSVVGAFWLGYYVRGLHGPRNGNGGNGEEMQVRRVA